MLSDRLPGPLSHPSTGRGRGPGPGLRSRGGKEIHCYETRVGEWRRLFSTATKPVSPARRRLVQAGFYRRGTGVGGSGSPSSQARGTPFPGSGLHLNHLRCAPSVSAPGEAVS